MKRYGICVNQNKLIKFVDHIYKDITEYAPGFELKYNKFYIGLSKDGITTNFVTFRPKKQFVYFDIKISEDEEINNNLDNLGIEYSYTNRSRGYRIKLNSIDDYKNNKGYIEDMIKKAIDKKNIEI